MSIFKRCKHDWEVVKDELLPSVAMLAREVGMSPVAGAVDPRTFIRKHLLVMKCLKCGKVYQGVTKTTDMGI